MPRVQTKCFICKIDIEIDDRWDRKVPPTCSGTCRGKLYRNINDTKLIRNALELNDFNYIKHISVERLTELGFLIVITEGILGVPEMQVYRR